MTFFVVTHFWENGTVKLKNETAQRFLGKRMRLYVVFFQKPFWTLLKNGIKPIFFFGRIADL